MPPAPSSDSASLKSFTRKQRKRFMRWASTSPVVMDRLNRPEYMRLSQAGMNLYGKFVEVRQQHLPTPAMVFKKMSTEFSILERKLKSIDYRLRDIEKKVDKKDA